MFMSIPTHACDPALRGHSRGWECDEGGGCIGLVASQSCFRRGKPNGERDGNCWSDSAGRALFLLKDCSYNRLHAFDLNLRNFKTDASGFS